MSVKDIVDRFPTDEKNILSLKNQQVDIGIDIGVVNIW